MTTFLTVSEGSEKQPSAKLRLMIENFASNLVESVKGWEEVKFNGMQEGFTEKELQIMVVPTIRRELEEQGYTGRQISNKLFYMFNSEEHKQRAKENRENVLTVKNINHNNDIEQCSSGADHMDWKQVAEERQDLIEKMSFGTDVFSISKQASGDREFYMTKVKPTEAITLLKANVDDNKLIEFAWRVLDE